MNELNKLAKEIYEGNKLRGFNVAEENVGQSLMLIVSELSEALESHRTGYYSQNPIKLESESNEDWKCLFELNVKDTFEDEIADSMIRLLDFCAGLEIDIEKHIELKLKYNSMREYKHGKAY